MAISAKALISALIILAFYLAMPLAAPADVAGTGLNDKAPAKLSIGRRTASDAEQMKPEAMLTDLRDFRLCLNQLKQEAVNLFQEATRTEVTLQAVPPGKVQDKISEGILQQIHGKYLLPRREWLVLYVNTIEPIVQLLCEDVQDVDTNGRQTPPAIESKINPLWTTWRDDVRSINKSLDEVQMLIGQDADSNVPLARAAIKIWQKAENLEKVRYRAVNLLRAEYIKEAAEKLKQRKAEDKSRN
ncbi:MAG: hypothetical protein KGS72_22550 [Cyanobacteria bacterium REEB67]|nr:hypothetical protein [Cyanobacteria bacterium REEB67]